MGLTKIRLGDYIECSTINNHDLQYGPELIAGVTNEGIFAKSKVDTSTVNLKPYKIVRDGAYVYNPTRLDLGSIAYRTDGLCIVSHLYIIFYLNEEGKEIIDPTYLYIYFRREEFWREVTFRNFGSQRPEFSFRDMSDIEINLPSLSVQQKYADIYKAMLVNQSNYKRGLNDLVLVFEGNLDRLKKEYELKPIGNYIDLIEDRNEDLQYGKDAVRGISIEKKFIETKADMNGVNLKPYYVVQPDEFAYVPVTSRNGEKISLALNESDRTYICSSSYVAFKSRDKNKLLPQYLMLYFSRSEFNRYARFNSWGSARETFTFTDMCDVEIPVPDISIQKAIADIYKVYNIRKKINEELKTQIKEICPILIKGSIEEASA